MIPVYAGGQHRGTADKIPDALSTLAHLAVCDSK